MFFNELEARHILLAIETFEAEIEQLLYDKEWYSADALDLMISSKVILHDRLGIKPPIEDPEHE